MTQAAETENEPVTVEAEAVTEQPEESQATAPAEGGAAQDVEIPKQQSAEDAADSAAGDGART